MDLNWIAQNVVAPVALSIVGIVTTVLVPLLGMKLKEKLQLDIDEKEQAKLDAIVVDTVHLVEATVQGGGPEKLREGLRVVAAQAAEVGIDIASDVAQAKIERALITEGIKRQ